MHYFCKDYQKFYFCHYSILDYLFNVSHKFQSKQFPFTSSFFLRLFLLSGPKPPLDFISYNLCNHTSSLYCITMTRYHLILTFFIFNASNSSFFPTRPNHLNLYSLISCTIHTTPSKPLAYSFLISSPLITPLSFLVFTMLIVCSILLPTNQYSVPYNIIVFTTVLNRLTFNRNFRNK